MEKRQGGEIVLANDKLSPTALGIVRGAKPLFIQAFVARLEKVSDGFEKIRAFIAERIQNEELVDQVMTNLLPFFQQAAAGVFSLVSADEVDIPGFRQALQELSGREVKKVVPLSLHRPIPSELTREEYWGAMWKSANNETPLVNRLLSRQGDPQKFSHTCYWNEVSTLIGECLWNRLHASFHWIEDSKVWFPTDVTYSLRTLIVDYVGFTIEGKLETGESIGGLLNFLSGTLLIGEKTDESGVFLILVN